MPRDNPYLRFLRDPDVAARTAELEAFVGRNPAPVLKLYERLRVSPERPAFGAMLGFVAMAFFLGPCWFFYRRMWIWAWSLVVVLVVLAVLPLPDFIGVVLGAVLATQGRYAYLMYAIGRIERLRAGAAVADSEVLRRAGGVSPIAGWASSGVYFVLAVVTIAIVIATGGVAR